MERTSRRGGAILALLIAIVAFGTAPVPVAACSCAMPEPLFAETFDPTERAVFIGTIGPDERRGVRVDVGLWYAGLGQAPVVWLDAGNFDPDRMGGACGIARLPVGTVWIMDAYRAEDGLFGVHLCSRQEDIATPAGQAMVTEAQAAFGDGIVFGGSPPAGPDVVQLLLGALLQFMRMLFGR